MTDREFSRTGVVGNGRRVKLLEVATWQRRLIVLVYATIALWVAMLAIPVWWPTLRRFSTDEVLTVLASASFVLTSLVALRLTYACGVTPLITLACAPLALVPCLNLLAMWSINYVATTILRVQGNVRVGLLGVPPSEFQRLQKGACAGCAYDIRGVQAGICPECGRPIT